MNILRAADHKRMPWKNGGGVTTEIAVSPPGAGLADFAWRVSMATVATDGPFSLFPNVDRTLAVLEGGGITLTIAGRAPLSLSTDSARVTFPGDVPASATLHNGAIVDLNVMTRRGGFNHQVAVLTGNTDIACAAGDVVLVFCAAGRATVTQREDVQLEPRDAIRLSAPARVTFNQPDTKVYIITLSPAA